MSKKLPQKEFLASFKHAPRPAVSLLITNTAGEVLLTKRAKPPYSGFWHLPGSFLLKDEKITDCAQRVARDELGLAINPDAINCLGVFENLNKDPRGHVIDMVYGHRAAGQFKLKPVGATLEAKFFAKLPTRIGFHHEKVLRQLGYSF